MKEKLLAILEENSRISAKNIAMMLEITEEEVETAIKELEDEGVILKYTTIINWEKADTENTVGARIDVKVQPRRETGYDDIARAIFQYNEVKSLQLMSGNADFAVFVEGKNILSISQFVSRKLSPIDGVQSTVTNFILKRYKENDVVFEDNFVDSRQVVTP